MRGKRDGMLGGVLAANVRHFGSNLLKCSREAGALQQI